MSDVKPGDGPADALTTEEQIEIIRSTGCSDIQGALDIIGDDLPDLDNNILGYAAQFVGGSPSDTVAAPKSK
ncbi:MAG: hypothetical protein JW991_05380 [Candidatus Pacebacteria bacterium]|nr:hypothetical protein [Candidatus Paceibacterota bacterium]